MRGRAASQLAWSLGALALALFVAGTVLSLLGSSPHGPRLGTTDRLVFAVFLTCAGVGALFARPGSLPSGRVVAWAGNSIWIPILVTAALIFLLFPTGRLRSPRWRPVVLLGLLFAAAAFASE